MTKLKHPDIVRFEEEMAKAEGLPAGQLHCVVLHVSPILGSYILANCNYGNRRIRRIAVAQWRARLREGRVKLVADAISFTADRQMNNGQHRLTGVVESGIGADFLFAFGESRDAFRVRDTGAARRAADVLSGSPPNGTLVASIARRVMLASKNRPFGGGSVDHDEIDEFIIENEPKLQEAARRAKRVYSAIGSAPGAVGTAFLLIDRDTHCAEGQVLIDRYVRELCDGSDAVRHLRDWFIRKRWGNGGKLTAALILGWYFWARGKAITSPTKCDARGVFPSVF